MNENIVLSLGREALWLMVVVSAPPILASLFVGFITSLFQATTQIQESTLSVVPKLCAAVAALAITGPWIASELSRFASRILMSLADVSL